MNQNRSISVKREWRTIEINQNQLTIHQNESKPSNINKKKHEYKSIKINVRPNKTNQHQATSINATWKIIKINQYQLEINNKWIEIKQNQLNLNTNWIKIYKNPFKINERWIKINQNQWTLNQKCINIKQHQLKHMTNESKQI